MGKVMKKILFQTRAGRGIVCCILGVILFLVSFVLAKINIEIKSLLVGLSASLLFGVAIVIFLLFFVSEVNYFLGSNFIYQSHTSLINWVKRNDIGDATSLIRSLSAEKSVQVFFRKLRSKYEKEYNEVFSERWVVQDKQIYLVATLKELLNEIDSVTRENIYLLKKYIDYESSEKIARNKIVDRIFSFSAISGWIICLKYAIDTHIKGIELENKALKDLSNILIVILIIVLFFGILVGYSLYRKRKIERNSKNLLDLVFKVIEEENLISEIVIED